MKKADDKNTDDIESRIKALETQLDGLEKTLRYWTSCKQCHFVYEYAGVYQTLFGDRSTRFDGMSPDFCSRCYPEEVRREEIAEWARTHPDLAAECKKRHEAAEE